MPLAFRDAITITGSGSSISVNPATTDGGLTYQVGDILVLYMSGYTSLANPSGSDVTWITTTPSDSRTGGPFGNTNVARIWVGVVPDASLSTFTIAHGIADQYTGFLVAFSGGDTASPVAAQSAVDASSKGNFNGTTVATVGSMSPAMTGGMLVGFATGWYGSSASRSWAPIQGTMTELGDAGGWDRATGAYELLSASGATGTRTFQETPNSTTSTEAWIAMGVVLAPASGDTSYTPTVTDNVGITDSATQMMDRVQAITDNVGITDAVTPSLGRIQSKTDSVGITDTATSLLGRGQTPTDTVGITDSVTFQLSGSLTQTLTDPVGITDSVTAVRNINITVTDTISIVDTDSDMVVGVEEVQTDVVGITDSASSVLARGQTSTDPIGITDSVTFTMARALTVTDAIGITDTFVDNLNEGQDQTDNVGITDSVTFVIDRAITVTDPVGITDSTTTSGTGTISQSVVDTVGITDSITFVLDRSVTVTDNVGITDATSAATDRSILVTDAVGITDSATPVLTGAISATDPVGITDSVTFVLDRVVTVTDSVGILDTTTASGAGNVATTDVVSISDSATFELQRGQSPTDVVGITDSVTFVLFNDGSVPQIYTYSSTLKEIYAVDLKPFYQVRLEKS